MKKLFFQVFFGALLWGNLSLAVAGSSDLGDRSKSLESDFRKLAFFSISYVGFIAQNSQEQVLFEIVLKDERAEEIFKKVIYDASGSAAAQLYSLCGLKLLSSSGYQKAKVKLIAQKTLVTTMSGDILRREEVGNIATRIDRSECEAK